MSVLCHVVRCLMRSYLPLAGVESPGPFTQAQAHGSVAIHHCAFQSAPAQACAQEDEDISSNPFQAAIWWIGAKQQCMRGVLCVA